MASEDHELMHETLPRTWPLLLFPLLALLLHYCIRRRRACGPLKHRPPPSPPALPVVGHLHLVSSLPHVSLRGLAARYGPDLMLLRLGAVPTVVVSSPRVAEAVLRTHDHVFASRPYSLITDIITYGSHDVGFAPYGEYWRQAKKLVTTHLLSVKKVKSFSHAREDEVGMMMAKISDAAAAGVAVDMSELLSSFTNDIMCRAVSGKFFRSDGRNKLFQELVQDTSQILGGFNAEEHFPVLARLGVLRTARVKAERLKKRWDELLDKVIDDHERGGCYQKDDDFISVLLSVKQEYGLTRDLMKAMLVDVFFGGIDTSANVLEFSIAELMRCPRSMKKLQVELRSSITEGQQIIDDGSLNNLAYLRAVIKESLRLHPVAPFLAPHFSMSDCTIDGFTIPARTRVLINAWAIGRDERSWEDADMFIPERFLAGGNASCLNFNGNDFQFLPFGAGRRICPGMNFGIANVEMMLANLIHRFDWEVPSGKVIDMSEVFGLTVRRKEKLLLVPKLCVKPHAC